MINKKFIVITVVLSICCLFGFSFVLAKQNNFVTMANGGGTKNLNTTTLGQAIVIAQVTDKNTIKSGYASVIMSSKSNALSFVDKTEKKTFDSSVVTVEIEVTVKEGFEGKIDQMAYKVGDGENPDFSKIMATEYPVGTPAKTITFKKDIDFGNHPTNQFWLWAQYKEKKENEDEDDYIDSSYIIITVNTQATSSNVTLESPDPLTRLSSIDPVIRTSKFSIDLSNVTVRLYDVTKSSPLYEVTASSGTEGDPYGIYDTKNSCISYLNSKVMEETATTLRKKVLEPNKEYRIEFDFSNEEMYQPFSLTFKALSGGVADIVTYPSPFNPKKEKIKIRYLLAKDGYVTIRLYDKAGKVVCKLIQSEFRPAGTNEEEWDGRNYAGSTLATGAYIVEIIANGDRRYTALAIVGK